MGSYWKINPLVREREGKVEVQILFDWNLHFIKLHLSRTERGVYMCMELGFRNTISQS